MLSLSLIIEDRCRIIPHRDDDLAVLAPCSTWEFPKIGDPHIVPSKVGSLQVPK